MPDPAELLESARFLLSGAASSTQARLSRAISTAYYALFHKVIGTAARRFMGPGSELSAGYTLIYRSFQHTHMREVCDKLNVANLNKTLKQQLRRDKVSQQMRDFAALFSLLQEQRHRADYDPVAVFDLTDVSLLIDAAEVGMRAFDQADGDEQADILALLMIKPRT